MWYHPGTGIPDTNLFIRQSSHWQYILSTLTSVASDLFNYALRLDNELSARPPRGRHGLQVEAVLTFINVDRFSNGRPPLTDLATPVDRNINAEDS